MRLGGRAETGGAAGARLVFLDARGKVVGTLDSPSVGPIERDGRTAMGLVARDAAIPPATTAIRAELVFENGTTDVAGAFANDAHLTLAEFGR